MASAEVDVVVLGLGPGGEKVAALLAEAGLDVVGIDSHLIGGECRFYGCTPTKMMVRAANAIAEGCRVPALGGLSVIDPDWTPVAERISTEATHAWDDSDTVAALEKSGVTIVRGHGRLVGEREVAVGDEHYTARRAVVIATGTDPQVPPIDGLAETPFWTNRDIVEIATLPGSLGIIGGGPIGAELAQVMARFGVRVTVLQSQDRLVAEEEPEASALLSDVFDREGIAVLTDVEITSVSHDEDRFELVVDDQLLWVDKLLVAVGRRTNVGDIGLETVGLDPAAEFVETDDFLRAGDGLFAIGDITGKGAFTHVATYQAEIVARFLLDDPRVRPADYRAVPRVTYTDPEIGSVGLTEAAAREQGLAVAVGTADLGDSSRGWLHGPGGDGLVKLVADTGRGVLVGASVVGPTGGELIAPLTLAVQAGVPTADLAAMIYAFPAWHAAIRTALDQLPA